MLAYHVDRLHQLKPGVLNLDDNYTGFDADIAEYCIRNFPKGLSRFGKKYTTDISFPGPESSAYIIESFFELIRRVEFSDKPSRFQSFFCCKSLSNAREWKLLLEDNDAGICEIDLSQHFEADAYWRDAAETILSIEGYFSPSILYSCAFNYWNGKQNSISRPEIVAPLPVTVVRVCL